MNLIDFGPKKGFVGLHTRPVKSKDCVGILLLPLDLGHVLAQLRITKVLFSHSLIDTICILVVTTAEARVPVKQLQLESELQGGRVGKHLYMVVGVVMVPHAGSEIGHSFTPNLNHRTAEVIYLLTPLALAAITAWSAISRSSFVSQRYQLKAMRGFHGSMGLRWNSKLTRRWR